MIPFLLKRKLKLREGNLSRDPQMMRVDGLCPGAVCAGI